MSYTDFTRNVRRRYGPQIEFARRAVGTAQELGSLFRSGGSLTEPMRKVSIRKNVTVRGEPGRYTGKFKARRRPPRPSQYATIGTRGEDEKYGTTNDDNVAYIGVRSYKTNADPGSISMQAAAALLKYIFKKEANIDIVSWHDYPYAQFTSTLSVEGQGQYPFNIRFYPAYYDSSGNATIPDVEQNLSTPAMGYYTLVADQDTTFLSLVTDVHTNVFQSAYFNGDNYKLFGYCLVNKDMISNVVSASMVSVSSIRRLDDIRIKAYSTVHLTVQNITTADGSTGDPNSTDRVDSNPIEGKILKFGTICPVPVESARRSMSGTTEDVIVIGNANDIMDENGDGIIYPELVAVSGQENYGFTQIPYADHFKFVKRESRVLLHPGELKRTVLKFKYNGLLADFLYGVCRKSASTIDRLGRKERLGTCILLAMEKVMSTGTSALTLNFEANFFAGAVIKRGKKLITLPYTAGATAASSD